MFNKLPLSTLISINSSVLYQKKLIQCQTILFLKSLNVVSSPRLLKMP